MGQREEEANYVVLQQKDAEIERQRRESQALRVLNLICTQYKVICSIFWHCIQPCALAGRDGS